MQMKTYLPLIILSTIIITILLYFKSMAIFVLEVYSSLLIDKPVTITKLNFIDSKIDCYIEDKTNILNLDILQVYPTYIDAKYSGDIDAFSKYHSLKGKSSIDAKVYYENSLLVDAKASLYSSELEVHVKQNNEEYDVLVDIKSLNLQKLQEENQKDYNLSGIVSSTISFKTPSQVAFNLKSENINVYDEDIKNINLDFNMKDDKYTLLSSSVLTHLGKTLIASNGTYKNELHAQADIRFQKEHIKLSNIKYIDKIISLNTSIFNGDISLNIKNDKVKYNALHVDISKALKFFKRDEKITGIVDLNGYIDVDDLTARVYLNSKIISTYTYNIEELAIEANSYMDNIEYKLSTNIQDEYIEANGNIKYKDGLDIEIFTNKFESDTEIYLKEDKFKIKSKHINLTKVQDLLEQDDILDGDIDLDANGTLENIDFKITSDELDILMYPNYFKDAVSLKIEGNYNPKYITLKPHIQNENIKIYDGYLTYNIDSKFIKTSQKILLKEKKDPIKLNLISKVQAPYNSHGKIIYKDDDIIINTFEFSDNRVKSDFSIDIKELSEYKVLTKKTMRGPLHVDANYHNDTLIAVSETFGGKLTLEADDEAVFIYANTLEMTKIDNILNLEYLFSDGDITGNVNFHRKTKEANTYIVGSDIVMNGMDIDKRLSTLQNALGLNIVALGKAAYKGYKYSKDESIINHLQFNTSLVDGNITLKDVAMSTNKFRISADGSIKQDGDINKLNINLLDKNGCSLITQGLGGNIKNPVILKKTGAVVSLISSMPSAILNTGGKIINFATKMVDDVATFTLQTTRLRDKEVTITTDLKDEGGLLFSNTSSMVLSNECKVIYDGKIKHPKQKH